MRPSRVTFRELEARHRGFLFDAYGVLLAEGKALPGAADVIERLRALGRPFFVVTNDASRTTERLEAYYRSLGLDLEAERILSSGALLARHFEQEGLRGARVLVLGPPDSLRLVEEAGGIALSPLSDDPFDVLAVCDEAGYPLLEGLEDAVTRLFAALDDGREVRLVLPNPDRLYPRKGRSFGIAAGSVALVLEDALSRRYGEAAPRFVALGKPETALFEEAVRRAGTNDLVMLGDQLETDIAGARRARIPCALVETGIGRWREDVPPERTPDYLLAALTT